MSYTLDTYNAVNSLSEVAKVGIFTHGISIHPTSKALLQKIWKDRPLSLEDYATTSGLTLRLAGNVWVNAPLPEYNANFVKKPHWVLKAENDSFFIEYGGDRIETEPISIPKYYNKTSSRGVLYSRYIQTHADRARISPVEGCYNRCKFCDLAYKEAYNKKPLEGFIEAITTAINDPWLPARHLLISGGVPKPEDYDYLKEIYYKIPQKFPDLEIDVMMDAIPELLDLRKLRDSGVSGLSINMELYNKELSEQYIPQKIGSTRSGFLDFLSQAVDIFPPGHVRSMLLVGLEPIEETLKGVEVLASIGVDPVLSAFRPDPSTPLRNLSPPSEEVQREVYFRSKEIIARYPGVQMGPRCKPCQHNTLTL